MSTPATSTPEINETLRTLCRRHRVKRLFIFGSGATGAMDSSSDLDFLVDFDVDSPNEHANSYFGLLQDLETLFQRRIDLLEQSAIVNPYLIRGIERSRRLVYEAA